MCPDDPYVPQPDDSQAPMPHEAVTGNVDAAVWKLSLEALAPVTLITTWPTVRAGRQCEGLRSEAEGEKLRSPSQI